MIFHGECALTHDASGSNQWVWPISMINPWPWIARFVHGTKCSARLHLWWYRRVATLEWLGFYGVFLGWNMLQSLLWLWLCHDLLSQSHHLAIQLYIHLLSTIIYIYIIYRTTRCMACSDNVVRGGLTPKFKDAVDIGIQGSPMGTVGANSITKIILFHWYLLYQ